MSSEALRNGVPELAAPRRERPAARRPISALQVLGWFLGFTLIAAALLPLVPPLLRPATPARLELVGELRQVAPEALRAALAPALQAPLHALDLRAVRERAEALAWVASARVERAWPLTVRVHVRERRAVARWGRDALLAEDGTVFVPDGAFDASLLPELSGPPGQEGRVREAYEALLRGLAGTGLEPRALALNARGEWAARTADDIELRLGRGAPESAVALLAGPVRTALAGRLQEVAYVDLHYVDGFAVGWRDAGPGGAVAAAGAPAGGG